MFYAPLTFAAAYGPGWLIAGTWQVTIIAGSLLVPLFGQKIPHKGIAMSLLILVGVALMQLHEAKEEIAILSAPLPSVWSVIGMALAMVGMVMHSYVSRLPEKQERVLS